VEDVLHRGAVRDDLPGQLLLGAREVERKPSQAPVAFEAGGSLALVGDETVDARAKERPELRPGGVVSVEEPLFQRAREERLRAVLRDVAWLAPLEPEVLVDGLPVGGDQDLDGAVARHGIAAAHGPDRRLTRAREHRAQCAPPGGAYVTR
jgi:hypothetical protein